MIEVVQPQFSMNMNAARPPPSPPRVRTRAMASHQPETLPAEGSVA